MILKSVEEIRAQLTVWVGNITYHLDHNSYPQDDPLYEKARLDCYQSLLALISEEV